MTDIFEKSSRNKLTFSTPKGLLKDEDLWDLPIDHVNRFSLNALGKTINRQLKDEGEEDFVGKPSHATEMLKLKLEIVKHIIKVRVAEAEENEKALADKQRREKLMEVIERRELEETPIEELKKQL